ncbi:MAG: glutamate synthase (NADPH/NADH) small chain [Gammaproteobacteria bacterium]|jgi:glutamate synthase (NADPH/NADH) small chain
MAKVTGFLDYQREKQPYRPVESRIHDWRQVMTQWPTDTLGQQAARCMDCGIPFCHQGCPLGNLIPDWNDLVYSERWHEAIDRLHATNNFPEFTGTLCPAPCEGACVLGINDEAVTIKAVELTIIDHAFEQAWVVPEPPHVETGKNIAVIGSGPAGLAAAQQLRRAGHGVVVFERADRIGGLLRYGIPDFKMEKRVLDRRLQQMEAEGVEFRTNANVGHNVDANSLRAQYDAVLLTGGATQPRDLPIPGRELDGVHFAMDFLTPQNRMCEGDEVSTQDSISATGKHVVIIGGGDTGADCLGTSHRQGAQSIHQLEIMPHPPSSRADDNPWPLWPQIYRVSSAHQEGGERVYSVSSRKFVGDGQVQALELNEVEMKNEDGRMSFVEIPGTTHELPCDLALLAMGFTGPEQDGLLDSLALKLTPRGTVWRDEKWMTSAPGVFTAGDMQRGQSLIVWAIAEGRSAARSIDEYLVGYSDLPAPLA